MLPEADLPPLALEGGSTRGMFFAARQRVDSNVNITLASTSTRQRPNAFNFWFQLQKKIRLGEDKNKLVQSW